VFIKIDESCGAETRFRAESIIAPTRRLGGEHSGQAWLCVGLVSCNDSHGLVGEAMAIAAIVGCEPSDIPSGPIYPDTSALGILTERPPCPLPCPPQPLPHIQGTPCLQEPRNPRLASAAPYAQRSFLGRRIFRAIVGSVSSPSSEGLHICAVKM
jgi:hypothetical protein